MKLIFSLVIPCLILGLSGCTHSSSPNSSAVTPPASPDGHSAMSLASVTNSCTDPTVNISPSSVDVQDGDTVVLGSNTYGFPDTYTSLNYSWSIYGANNPNVFANGYSLSFRADLTFQNASVRLSVSDPHASGSCTASASAQVRVRPNQTEVNQRQQFMNLLFLRLLGRASLPTATETAGFMQSLSGYDAPGCGEFATSFLSSPEFQNDSANMDSTTFIHRIYTAFLNRDAAAGEISNDLANLANGTWNRSILANILLTSPEFNSICYNVYGWPAIGAGSFSTPPIPDGASSAELDQRANFSVQLFVNILGRDPSTVSASQFRPTAAQAGSCSQAAANVIGSPEFAGRNATLSTVDFVTALYAGLLRVGPDVNQENALDNGTISRQGLVDAILQSPSFNQLCISTYGFDGAGRYTMGAIATPTSVPPNLSQTQERTNYIQSLYSVILGRTADSAGLANYQTLLSQNVNVPTCAQVAGGFLQSAEFTNRELSLSTADFVQALYEGLLGRSADSATVQNYIASGASRQAIADSVLQSAEFNQDCISKWGFTRAGSYSMTPIPVPFSSTILNQRAQYITLLYNTILGRAPDASGFAGWNQLVDNPNTAPTCSQLAISFLMSPEFLNKNKTESIQDYVTSLYVSLLGRQPDAAGLAGWSTGAITRQAIADGFLQSEEFNNLCQSTYGFPAGAGVYSGLAIPQP